VTLAEIKDEVDHISETWRDGAAEEQRAELAQLDDALAELDEIDADTASAAAAVEDLRGRIEILMDEIEIGLGLEPAPIEGIDELEIVELVPEEENALIRLDDPKATALISTVKAHLASGASADTLREDLDAIDNLDEGASSALQAKLDDLRAQIERMLAQDDGDEIAPKLQRLTPAARISGRPRFGPARGR